MFYAGTEPAPVAIFQVPQRAPRSLSGETEKDGRVNTIAADRLFSDPRLKRLSRELGCPFKALGALMFMWHGTQNLGVCSADSELLIDTFPLGVRDPQKIVRAFETSGWIEPNGSEYRIVGNGDHVQAREIMSNKGKEGAQKRWGQKNRVPHDHPNAQKMPTPSNQHGVQIADPIRSDPPHLVPPRTIDLVHEVAHKDFETRHEARPSKKLKGDPTPIALVRRAFLDGYAARFPNAPPYPWGSRENGQAKNWLTSATIEEALSLIPRFFKWPRPEVIRAGFPFCTGSNSLVMKYIELRADIVSIDRRDAAAMIASDEKQYDHNAEGRAQTARVVAAINSGDQYANDPFGINTGNTTTAIGSGPPTRGGVQPQNVGRGGNGLVQSALPIRER